MELSMEKKAYFPPKQYKNNFILIGAGGTGGYLVPNLARILSVVNANFPSYYPEDMNTLTIVDGDEVETHNINRQNFVRNDIGKMKAEVLANRYGQAFGLEIKSCATYLENNKQMDSFMNYNKGIDAREFIISCVDNHRTRQMIHNYIMSHLNRTFIWLDAGNEEWNGQVVFGANTNTSIHTAMTAHDHRGGRMGDLFPTFDMPFVTEIYPDILENTETKFNSEMSCDERAVHEPQSIATNITAANIMFNFLNLYLLGTGVPMYEVRFNTQSNNTSTSYNKMSDPIFTACGNRVSYYEELRMSS